MARRIFRRSIQEKPGRGGPIETRLATPAEVSEALGADTPLLCIRDPRGRGVTVGGVTPDGIGVIIQKGQWHAVTSRRFPKALDQV